MSDDYSPMTDAERSIAIATQRELNRRRDTEATADTARRMAEVRERNQAYKAAQETAEAAKDWADHAVDELRVDECGNFEYEPENAKIAAALRTAKQAGADEERARCLRIASTVRAGHQAIFERPAVEALDNVIDLIEGGK